MLIKRITSIAPWILSISFLIYTLLSWILLFRDKRALEGISSFYPFMETFLFSTRSFLLENNLNTLPTFVFGLVSITAIVCYLLSLKANISLRKTLIFAVLFQLITFISYPILSTDIFSYMFSERVATVHNESLWKVAPANFPDDPFYKISDWKETTSVYGAVHFMLYFLPSVIAGNNLLLLTILYKLIAAIFALGTGYILYKLLKEYKPDFVEKGLRLVFWSPLFVLEIFGSGHNDSIMIFFVLLSWLFYKKKKLLFAGVSVAAAAQVKILPVVLLFFFVLFLFKKKQLHDLVLLLFGFIFTTVLAFIFMQVNPVDFLQRVLYNNGVYWQSLANLLRFYIQGSGFIIIAGFFIWLGYFTQHFWRKPKDPIYGYITVMLVYLLFVSSAYWNWYVLWILPLLPFIEGRKVFWTTLVFSFTSLLAYPLLWLSLRFGFGSFIWPIITFLFIFGIPIVIYILLRYEPDQVKYTVKKLALQKIFADVV